MGMAGVCHAIPVYRRRHARRREAPIGARSCQRCRRDHDRICRVRCTWDDTGEWLDESEQRLRWCALESD